MLESVVIGEHPDELPMRVHHREAAKTVRAHVGARLRPLGGEAPRREEPPAPAEYKGAGQGCTPAEAPLSP